MHVTKKIGELRSSEFLKIYPKDQQLISFDPGPLPVGLMQANVNTEILLKFVIAVYIRCSGLFSFIQNSGWIVHGGLLKHLPHHNIFVAAKRVARPDHFWSDERWSVRSSSVSLRHTVTQTCVVLLLLWRLHVQVRGRAHVRHHKTSHARLVPITSERVPIPCRTSGMRNPLKIRFNSTASEMFSLLS